MKKTIRVQNFKNKAGNRLFIFLPKGFSDGWSLQPHQELYFEITESYFVLSKSEIELQQQ